MDGIYTQQFNRRHRRDGTLFRGRYKAILIDADEYLAAVVRYIHLNAVEAGLAKMEMGHQQEFYPSPSTPCLGEQSFVDDYRERVTEKTTAAAGEVKLIPLERLFTGSKAKMPLEMLRSPTQVRKVTAMRQEFVLNAIKMGYRPSMIAAFLRCSPSAISKIVARSL